VAFKGGTTGMKKILDYQIVERHTINELRAAVLAFIAIGWVPLSGAIPAGRIEWFMQTMVKYE
jgi:hypothetical protein